jgi:glycosyltransferase involved in cell wall biosynthesis|tara:strand:+ start:4628 stop:5830 length:1203 start_codon:yes stop_codon:yes gene_type:complete
MNVILRNQRRLETRRNLQDVLKEGFMSPSYLDRFDLSFDLPKMSVIVPTFNRCPYPLEEDANPLGWCIKSLLAQKSGGLSEIVIVDDSSTDHTADVVRHLQDVSHVPIIYSKNPENKGSSISRNIGVNLSSSDQVMFLDDDCVFSKYFLFGANFTLNQLGEDAAALQLPVYHRKKEPELIGIKDIGVLDLEEGVMTGNFDRFPREYLKDLEDHFLDSELKILRPIQIRNLAGVFLTKKDLFQEAGGFPEDLTWRNGYREETGVALKLQDRGHEIYFTPDPKFYCVHLKYGEQGGIHEKTQKLEPDLRCLVDQSSVSRTNTGNRVDTEQWFHDFILSTYVTLGQRSLEAATEYLERTHEQFVLKNAQASTGVRRKIEDPSKRKDIFERAIAEGDRLLLGGD